MDLGLGGKRAVVCGSSRGLGLACALALAEAGADVVLNGRSSGPLERAREEVEARAGRPVLACVAADVTTPQGRDALLAACSDPDVLVTNAAGPPPGRYPDWDERDWEAAVAAQMIAPIRLITRVLGPMRARGWGRVVNITSSAVKEPLPLLGLSTGARLGLTGFVASVAREAAADGVTINNLLPGRFETDRLAGYVRSVARARGVPEAQARREALADIPAGRMGDPAEFGAVCAFLASRWAGYVTGQNLVLDGGAHHGTL